MENEVEYETNIYQKREEQRNICPYFFSERVTLIEYYDSTEELEAT